MNAPKPPKNVRHPFETGKLRLREIADIHHPGLMGYRLLSLEQALPVFLQRYGSIGITT